MNLFWQRAVRSLSSFASTSRLYPSAGPLRLLRGLALGALMPIAALPGMAVAQQASGHDTNSSRADSLVESDLLSALNSSSVLKSQPITAATIDGEVTLSGNVSDAASKELAGMLVSRIDGVRSVNNNLTVGTQSGSAEGPSLSGASDNQQLPASQANVQGYPQEAGTQERQQEIQQYGQASVGSADPRSPASPGNPQAARAPYPASSSQYPASSQYPPDGGAAQASSVPVQIPQGTLLKVRLSELLDARRAQKGTMFEAIAASDVYSGGALAIPRGAVLEGEVVDVSAPKGALAGSASLTLKVSSLLLGGKSYVLDTDVWLSNGPGKGGYTAGNTVTGAAVGAIIGGIAGGGLGAGIGAAAGGVTGAAASAATSGPRLVLPPETLLTFHLANAVSVVPVGYQEAQRLATANQLQGQPGLQRRGSYAYPGPYAGYPPPPIAYGYPYGYRPYYYYPRYRGYFYGGYYGR